MRIRELKLHLEEGYFKQLLHEELGIGKSNLSKWVKDFKDFVEDALKIKVRSRKPSRVSSQVEPVR